MVEPEQAKRDEQLPWKLSAFLDYLMLCDRTVCCGKRDAATDSTELAIQDRQTACQVIQNVFHPN